MRYASLADIQCRYSDDLIYTIADRDRDGVLDQTAIDTALDDATTEVDSYLIGRYARVMPFTPVPAMLVAMTARIAVYRLALAAGADAISESLRASYQADVSTLQRLQDGRQTLPVALPSDGADVSVSAASGPAYDPVVESSPAPFGYTGRSAW